jgi:hypothetical protein
MLSICPALLQANDIAPREALQPTTPATSFGSMSKRPRVSSSREAEVKEEYGGGGDGSDDNDEEVQQLQVRHAIPPTVSSPTLHVLNPVLIILAMSGADR